MAVETIDTIQAADALADEWNQLAESVCAQPFALPALGLAWWRHLGAGALHIATARSEDGRLVGLAPLFLRSRGPVSTASFLGHGLGAVGELLVDTTTTEPVAESLWHQVADAGPVLMLPEFRHGGGGLDELRFASPFDVDASLRDVCPTLRIPDGGAAEFLQGKGRRNLRQQLARSRRRLDSAGSTTTIIRSRDDLANHIGDLRSIYDAAEAGRPRTHLLAGPYEVFFVEAMNALAEAGQLCIIMLSVADRPVAFDLYVTSGSVAYGFLCRFDPAAREFSPGQVLIADGVDHWAADPTIDLLDLQIGGDEYKLRWADGRYDTLTVTGAPAGRLPLARALTGGLEQAHRVRRSLRSAATRIVPSERGQSQGDTE